MGVIVDGPGCICETLWDPLRVIVTDDEETCIPVTTWLGVRDIVVLALFVCDDVMEDVTICVDEKRMTV